MRSRVWDSQDFRVTQGFSAAHLALDVAMGNGTPLYSPEAGRVVIAKPDQYGGLYIDIDTPNGKTRIVHLGSFAVGLGNVAGGQLIGYSDNTGLSTGPHSHVELWKGGVRVDPTSYLLGGGDEMTTADNVYWMYRDILGRANGNAGDPGSNGYIGKPWANVYNDLYNSQEAKNYREGLAQQYQKVIDLGSQVASLNTQLTDIKTALANKDAIIADLGVTIEQNKKDILALKEQLANQPPAIPQPPVDPIGGDTRDLITKIVDWIKKYILK